MSKTRITLDNYHNYELADSLNNSSKYEKLQVLKLKAIESENYEFCIVLRNKQQEYSSNSNPALDGQLTLNPSSIRPQNIYINNTNSSLNAPNHHSEFLKFLKKIPAKHEHYFYAHLKDRFVSELCVDESIPAATNRSHFEQVIKRLSPSTNGSSTTSRTGSTLVAKPSETLKKLGLYITEENYQYAITHCKMLLKELNFVLWMEGNQILAQTYTELSNKELQHLAGKCEHKLSKFAEKLSEFLKLADTVQKNVIQQGVFMSFINFSLSVYWVYSYVTFLLHERHTTQSSSVESSKSDVASSSKSLLLNRKVVSVLLTNLQSVVKEIDYLNEHDFPSKMNPGTLLLGKKFDLVDGAVLQTHTHKNIVAAILA